MSWHYPLLELSLASVAKDPRLCIPEHLSPLPPHIKVFFIKAIIVSKLLYNSVCQSVLPLGN